MQSIGEKLEEARKRRGISLREASEVTKIRSEYLGGFETNSFDLNIPEVYIRGFLRSYAKFLKLNGDKIITDYNAYKMGESKVARTESREFLGRMDLAPESGGESGKPADAPAAFTPRQPPAPASATESGLEYNNFDRASLIKGGAALAGAGVLVAVIIFVVLAVLRSGSDEPVTAAEPTRVGEELTLIANGGDILSVTVTEVSTRQELFRGPLPSGQRQRIPFEQQTEVRISNSEFLDLEHNGERVPLGARRGPGRIIYPQN